MCEQCKSTDIDCTREVVAKARPDQIMRLLEDIRACRARRQPGDPNRPPA